MRVVCECDVCVPLVSFVCKCVAPMTRRLVLIRKQVRKPGAKDAKKCKTKVKKKTKDPVFKESFTLYVLECLQCMSAP